ncbi:hypothetical protein Aph01nite_17400 [Acrocarpospora phusangensis]|uniref:Secreted protein n=1 Tax=Acrocarpospora phusangensis TaxID=1070424 RepID=A0A919Q9X3_9ACTN|nr:hypothetical protein [Acrocarpospora phusangensis]GIH23430.1 hypothetical protein Aph01nite_17400 [Acrocarpospora phusangensis]
MRRFIGALAGLVTAGAVLTVPAAAEATTAVLPPVRDECVTSVKALPPVIDNIWRKWGAERSPLGCPGTRELVQRKRELSGGVDGVVEQVTFQFGVIIEAPRLGPAGWIALYQGDSVHLDNSMHVAWEGAAGRVPDSAITVGWWTDNLKREPYRQLAGSRFAKNANAWSWINLHNNLQRGTKYSVQLQTPGTCVQAGTPGYCYLAPPISIMAQQSRDCKAVPIGTVGTYWRNELKRSTAVWGCPVGPTGVNVAGFPAGTSRQHFEYGALTYRPDADGAGAMVVKSWWETRTNAKNPGLFVKWESTLRSYDVWQVSCTANHDTTERCTYESDDSLLRPLSSIISSIGSPKAQRGRLYVRYTFQAQGCLRRTLAPSKCSGWSPAVTLRWPKPANPAPGG